MKKYRMLKIPSKRHRELITYDTFLCCSFIPPAANMIPAIMMKINAGVLNGFSTQTLVAIMVTPRILSTIAKYFILILLQEGI